MRYTAPINRQHPACCLLLLDQSESMLDPFVVGARRMTKAEGAADAVNRVLENLLLRCTKGADDIRDYFYVGVIGYGAEVGSALPLAQGEAPGLPALVPISQLTRLEVSLGQRQQLQYTAGGGVTLHEERYPIYVEPIAANGTPMCQALQIAHEVLDGWAQAHPASFPPLAINVTDGEASDGSPVRAAEALRRIATEDGPALFFNCHLSSSDAPSVVFPETERDLVDDYARRLFLMSSALPPSFLEAAASYGYPVTAQARGFAFNADLTALINFLDIGTQPFRVH